VSLSITSYHTMTSNNNDPSVMATPPGKTKDNFETQFGTNHLSHFLLFNLIKPLLLAGSSPTSASRVITVSSLGHRIAPTRPHDFNFTEPNSYQPWLAYGQAKTANIHLANGISRRFGSQNLHGLSLHPGGIMTNLQQHLPDEQVRGWKEDPTMSAYMKSPAQGAATSVYAALGKEWEGKGLLYLSDCQAQGPFQGEDPLSATDEGYQTWAFDQKAEDELWEQSLKMVGLVEE
jgi:NAD(P)-dependent dehydrogenase (short-subunit alcohol dehydrogenase family)